MMWRGICGHPYTITLVQVRVDFKENRGGAEPKQCCNVMVEAPNLHRLHPTSMSYVYTVFQHLDMLWMGIWGTLTLLRLCRAGAGVDFRKIELSPSPSDVVMSYVMVEVESTNPHRLFPTSMSYVYTVFQHLDMLWMGIWVYPYTVTVTYVQVGSGV